MILLIGYGYWGKNLARNFGPHLSAICEADRKKIEIIKKIYPNVNLYSNLADALKDKSVTAVAIATKANTHHDIAINCLESGKDLWIEKPVCETITEIKHLEHIAKKNNKIIFVDHTFCYHPAVVKLKEINIGKPLYYDSTRISLGLFQPDVDVVLDLAIHDVSILNFLYPDLELKNKTINKNSHISDQANQAIINLKFTSGFTANINVNWISPVKKRQIILAGTHSSVIYDDLDNDKIKIYQTGEVDRNYDYNKLGDMISPRLDSTEALQNASQHFIECCKNRTSPKTDISSSLKIMEWIL